MKKIKFTFLLFTLLFSFFCRSQTHLNFAGGYIFANKSQPAGKNNLNASVKTFGGFCASGILEQQFHFGGRTTFLSFIRVGTGITFMQQKFEVNGTYHLTAPSNYTQNFNLNEIDIPLKFKLYHQFSYKYTTHLSFGAAFRIPLSSDLTFKNNYPELTIKEKSNFRSGQPALAFPMAIGFTRIFSNTQVFLELGCTPFLKSISYETKNNLWVANCKLKTPAYFSLNMGVCIL